VFGVDFMRVWLQTQVATEDVARFIDCAT